MFSKFAYSTLALTVSLGTVMSCQAEVTGTNFAAAFDHPQQINAGDLNVGYVDIGPKNGQPVILLHGWPYDIHSYADVAPALAAKGYRVIVPSLRGYGTTRFLSAKTPRNGQPSAMAKDIVNLMDALNIKQAVFAGYDWGARTADIVAALWPERVKSLVSVSGYLISSQQIGKQPLPPKAEQQCVARRNFSHRNALNYAPQQTSEKPLLRTVQIKTPRSLSHSNDEAGNLR